MKSAEKTTRASSRPRRLFVWFNAQSLGFHDALAEELKKKHGWETVLFCESLNRLPPEAEFRRDVFAEIVSVEDDLRPRSFSSDAEKADVWQYAEELEQALGVNISEILRVDRHLGWRFIAGGNYPQSKYSKENDWTSSLDIACRLIKRFDEMILRDRPLAVMLIPGMAATAALFQVSRTYNIPMRTLVMSRIAGRFYWSIDHDNRILDLPTALERNLSSPKQESTPMILSPPQRAQMFRSKIEERRTHAHLVRRIIDVTHSYLARKYRRLDQTYGGVSQLDRYRFVFQHWKEFRRMWLRPPLEQDLPEGMRFILYPLQREPEASIMMEAPMADNQLTVIDLLSKTAPAGWFVVVKEHFSAMGLRPHGFYEKIARYPNVILASPRDDAMRLTERSSVVAVINGSVGIQAAIAGHPVITFHPMYQALGLPHVFHADSYYSLRKTFELIRKGEIPTRQTRIAAGRALHSALMDTSFELDAPRLADPALRDPLPEKTVSKIAGLLVASLPSKAVTTSPTAAS